MADDGRFLCRELCSLEQGELRILDALRWPTPLGTGLRIYTGVGIEAAVLRGTGPGGVDITEIARVAGITVISACGPAGEGAVTLRIAEGSLDLPTALPETDLFDDLDVFIAQRHHETPDQLAEWLRYHTAHHGLTGVVLFDRSEPGPSQKEFATAMQAAVRDIGEIQRFVLVTSPLALGRTKYPALGDPALAPRRKNRSFTPDRWRAPLAEAGLYDILKWRFLTRAGAVIALDPCDVLRPSGDGIGAFQATRKSHTGLMPVQGQMIYPWRVRKGRDPSLGDHICRADPPVRAPGRWALAPKRAAAGTVWLPGAVAGMAGLADETLNYDRASSVLSPDAEVAALVDKDLLVADAALIERAGAAFAQRPILPPERAAALAAPIMAQPSGRTLIVTCMKNEGPFILEWLAYHRMIGVDDFLIYTNDCDDGTDAMLDALQAKGLVQRRDNPFGDTGTKPQHAALQAAQSEDLVRNAGWIISMDVDEFINIHVGANRLDDLYAAIGDAGLISLTWRLFGNDDIHDFRDRPVIGQFTRCAPQLIRRPHQAWGFKTLFRNQGQWDGFGVHRPRGFRGGPVKWVNGSGKPMPKSMLRSGWRSGIDTYGYDLVTLNHYAVRSVESFLVKRDRGRVNHVARDQGEAYWFRMNNNDEPDFSIQRHMHGLDEALADLKSDPAIGALHDAAVAAHRARIRQLMAQPDYGALYDRLTGARMQRLSRMHRHFGMNVFLHGPSVVPDRVLEQDVPPDFFFNTAPPDAGAAD